MKDILFEELVHMSGSVNFGKVLVIWYFYNFQREPNATRALSLSWWVPRNWINEGNYIVTRVSHPVLALLLDLAFQSSFMRNS